MKNALDQAYDSARQLSEPDQEVLGRVLQAATEGRTLSVEQAAEDSMVACTMEGLACAERGEGMPVDEARQHMDRYFETLTPKQ